MVTVLDPVARDDYIQARLLEFGYWTASSTGRADGLFRSLGSFGLLKGEPDKGRFQRRARPFPGWIQHGLTKDWVLHVNGPHNKAEMVALAERCEDLFKVNVTVIVRDNDGYENLGYAD